MSHGATLLHLRGTAGKDAIYRKISWRLLPLPMLCYLVACLDRVNLGYAQAQMKVSLDFGDGVQLWGAAIFFLGYCLFQLPCNLLLEKIGAGKMLLRVMLFWGVTASAGALVRTPFEFYAIRFLLGVCEAGLFPGVILYLTYWYPAARRARVIAVFASAALIAGLLGGPLSTVAQQYLHQQNGLQGWQWLLLMPGLPAMALGIIAYCYLDDRPGDAGWLSPFEQLMVEQDLERDEAALGAAPADDEDDDGDKPSRFEIAWGLLRDPAISLLALANLLLMAASYTLVAWTMQRWSTGLLTQAGWLALIPGVAGVAGMIAIGYDSDRRHERRGHFIACMVLAAGGLGLAIVGTSIATSAAGGAGWPLAASLAGLSLASLGVAAAAPLLVSILTDLLTRRRAAIGIALVGGAGALGGVVGPALGAWLLAWGGGAVMLAVLILMVLAAGAALLLALRLAPRRGGRDARLSALAHMG
jgi:MFS family permease